MFDSLPASVGLETRRIALPALTGARARASRRRLSSALKRVFDAAAAAVALLVLLWAFVAIGLAIALTSRGPIFFRQRRTGLNGQVFSILKFRSMSVVEDGDVIAHARRDDERVTPVGSFLRKTSLDELPQLINVLMGDMSIVGPRPHAVAHDLHYGALIPQYHRRFEVRPGLTGLAQVHGLRGEIRELDCMVRRAEADAEYVDRWSFRGDLMIILQTIPLLLSRENAY